MIDDYKSKTLIKAGEDPRSGPDTRMVLTALSNNSLRISNALFGPPWVPGSHMMDMPMLRHPHRHTNKMPVNTEYVPTVPNIQPRFNSLPKNKNIHIFTMQICFCL